MNNPRFHQFVQVAIFLVIAVLETIAAEPAASWVRVTEKAVFSPRDTSEDTVFDGRMWLSNAYHHGNKLVRDLWCSKDGRNWTCVSTNTPYDGYSEMVAFDNKLWAIKGSVWNSTDGTNWTRVLEKTPFGVRGYGEVVVHDGRMWQLGSGAGVWNTRDGAHWNCVTNAAPYGWRAASAVAVYKGKLWLNGGRTEQPSNPPEKHYPKITTHNDVWCSADGAHWTRVLEHAPWAPRQWFIAREYAGKLWIIGGFDNRNSRNLGDVWFTEDGVTWKEFVSETRFAPRHEPTVYVFDSSLWVVAGNCWPLTNDVWRLTLP